MVRNNSLHAINPADGQRVTTTWTYDEYTTGLLQMVQQHRQEPLSPRTCLV